MYSFTAELLENANSIVKEWKDIDGGLHVAIYLSSGAIYKGVALVHDIQIDTYTLYETKEEFAKYEQKLENTKAAFKHSKGNWTVKPVGNNEVSAKRGFERVTLTVNGMSFKYQIDSMYRRINDSPRLCEFLHDNWDDIKDHKFTVEPDVDEERAHELVQDHADELEKFRKVYLGPYTSREKMALGYYVVELDKFSVLLSQPGNILSYPKDLDESTKSLILSSCRFNAVVSRYKTTKYQNEVEQKAAILPGIKEEVINPVTGDKQNLYSTIINLNDSHGWSRERIADWLETLDVDLAFPSLDTPAGSEVQ